MKLIAVAAMVLSTDHHIRLAVDTRCFSVEAVK